MGRKIAVCDDDRMMHRQLAGYLEQYQQETGRQLQIFYFSSGEDLLKDMPEGINILLLDIRMGGLNGIEVARALRERGLRLHIFFITSDVTFALEGYDVHAYAFLEKPLQYSQFKRNMDDALRQLERGAAAVLKLRSGTTTDILRCRDIIYAEVFVRLTRIVMRKEVREYVISLAEVEEQIEKYGFFRCHKSYLVNMKEVVQIGQSDVLMSNGAHIPLSKHRRKKFEECYLSFIGGSL